MAISKSKIFGDGLTLNRVYINSILNFFTSLKIIKAKLLFTFVLLIIIFKGQFLFAHVLNNVKFTSVSSTSLSVSWDAHVPDTNKYYVAVTTIAGLTPNISSGTVPDTMGPNATSFINLQPNTSHTVLVKNGNDSDAEYVAISTYTWAVSPGIVGFNIYADSASIILDAGLNNLGNATSTPLTLAVSTGNNGDFSVPRASSGFVTSQISTFIITGLSLNTNYSFQASATNYFGLRSTATTVTSSTYTTSAPPNLASFAIFTTSISVELAMNGNASSTPLMISTGTDGNFDVSNSSIGVFADVPTTLVISNLSTATVYSFQAGTRGTYANASTQTITVSASTYTFAAPPLLSGYKIFATSITVNINPNTNPNGTGLSISTNSFTVSSSSIGVVGGNPTPLSLLGLIPNTAYSFTLDMGAFDGRANASTQSVAGTEISTTTLAAPPTLVGYQIFTTSISVTLGRNGNPANTRIMISTGTSGHFNVSNSSVGLSEAGDTNTTLVISNLSTATVYGFQAGTVDSSANASTQTITVTASTSTLAVAPSLSSFQVFATSIAVRIDPNTNPNGTMLSISTNAFNTASSSVGAAIGITTITITNLTPNVAYNLNIGAFDSTVSASTQSASGNEISSRTLAAVPTITSFQIFSSSISVTVGANGNPNGTALMISTGSDGNLSVDKSSVGVVAGNNTTLILENLSLDTNYAFQAGARDSSAGASTQSTTITASTYTTSAPPILSSFQIFTTSISVILALNGNASSTPLMISTGTDGNFSVTNSSISTFFNGPPTTIVISNLSTATAYGFQAGTRGTYANASTQTITITASTSTLAVAPSLNSFQVFATSIAVRINPNTNPNGTMLSISTNNFGVASSSIGAAIGITTLTISNLIPNSDYDINIGAFDSTQSASTQNASGNEVSSHTLAAVPTLVGFQVFSTSISVTLGQNGNPLNTPLMISTGNAGNFSVSNSSVGVVAAANTTLVITGLAESTNYAVQAGARDSTANASTQSITVTASTTTTSSDSTAPAAITSLSALIGNSSGTITLSWISPGDDNLTGDLNSSTFRLFYSSISSDMDGLNATASATETLNRLDISTTGVSPYTTRNRTLSDLVQDVTYYVRAFTADDQTNWSAISNAATATAQGTILSITFDNNSYAFGTFNAPQSTISATAMKVTNSGTVVQRYQIKATTSTANSPWSLGNARGNNVVVVNGLFNAARPADVDFESVSSTLTITNTASGASGGTFAGDQTGTAVPANADRNFWIRLGMPLSTTTTAQQQIQIIITAEQSP
ncbi:MAG: hypothetical protein A3I11_08635 [Elusimicrobia bacterium RIFCSPLOWO2_02_FULL_39_32]|nr:MAG: hypothetical protein A3B80_03525 [Elusimicrobia bacterium RIFCSPHIGHO2_02_FULL_39_36]OGR93073.1 MAG: hypothetical protein A3I11_08635 [Elusimicrobia bacterium RIFCSPLOWO2_02_FULL_39_32]OGS00356.1 MAG: hypothetical protein A3G85_00030 [Elusimicrobia bacterium RIFCSPLOWO2_12_FULL_39_28]